SRLYLRTARLAPQRIPADARNPHTRTRPPVCLRAQRSTFEYHGEAHRTRSAHRDQAHAEVTALHLIQQCRREARARSTERMADSDAPAHDVDAILVDDTGLSVAPELVTRERVGVHRLEIRHHLCGERLVYLPQLDVLHGRAGA